MYVYILYICISYMYICICSVNRVWDVFTVNLSLCPFTLFFSFQACNESTYQEVVRATCGKVTGILCEVAIAVYTFGTCIAFFIVIGDQLDRCEYNHSEATNIPQLGANVWFWWAEIHTYTWRCTDHALDRPSLAADYLDDGRRCRVGVQSGDTAEMVLNSTPVI